MASDPPLSKEEQEEEEMRNELTAVGLFDETMDKTEMKSLVKMLQESRAASKATSPPFKATQNDVELLENSPRGSTSSFHPEDVDVGNLPSQSTSEKHLNNNEKNSESTSNIPYVKNIHNECLDVESNSEKNTNLSKEDYPSLRSAKSYRKSNIGDTLKVKAKENKKPSAAILKRRAAERWRLNPLQFDDGNEDIPLKRPECFDVKEDGVLPCTVEELDSKKFDELCQQMNEKLDTLREKIILDEPITDRKSRWGAPIKAAPKWNGSLDKTSVVEKASLQTRHSPEISLRDTYDRATKRKAISTMAAVTRHETNDDNSDGEFVTTKKRKFQQEKKAEVTKKDQETKKNKSTDHPVEMIEVDDMKDTEDFDNSNLRSLRRNPNRNTSSNTESNEEQSEYPRRVTPPNPSKKKFYKGPRAKTKTATDLQSSFIKKNGLNDEEITKTLNELNEQIDDNDEVEITDEIRPAPVSKNLIKLQAARSHLENVRNTDDQKIKAEEEARKQKEREERQKKDELIAKRWQEQENETKRKLDIERKSYEKTEIYNNHLNSQSRVTRSNYKTRQNYEEYNEDATPLNGNDDGDEPMEIRTNLVAKKPCPICQKPFSVDEIISHASECDEYFSESDNFNIYQPSTSRSRIDSYECFICNNYKTTDGSRFDDHTTQCKANAEDMRNEIYA